MHQTSLDKIKAFVEEYLEEFEDTELIIIDVGAKSYLNNPTYRFFFNKPKWKYLGLDLEAGNNVDIVVSDPYNWKEVPSDFADVIVSGQAFEHIEFPWLTIKEIFRVLKPGGICCIIAPYSEAEHKYPHDCRRFYLDGMKALGKWAGFKVVEIFTDWGLGEWQDTFAVFQKPFSNSAPFPDFSNKKVAERVYLDVETLTQLAYLSESTNSYHLMQVCYGKLMKELPKNVFFKAMFGLSHKALGDEETFRKIFKELLEYQLRNNILNRTTIIQRLINRFGYKNYLEIGVERGINFFQIEAEFKIAVDPAFIIPGGYQDTEKEKFHQMTSDEFFANPPKEILEKGLDIVFVDGLHTYEQSLRDVENALRYLSNNGIIVIHDCLPNSPVNAMPTYEEAKQHPDFEGNWTGEVYKTIIHLRALRDDLFIAVVNVDWGVGIVKKGNPEGMVFIKVDDIRRMSYDDFAKDKERLLNLKPKDWFYEFIETKYSF
jgi:SAM-dependent methyltransferase